MHGQVLLEKNEVFLKFFDFLNKKAIYNSDWGCIHRTMRVETMQKAIIDG